MVAGQIALLTVGLVDDARYPASRISFDHHRLFELAR
jgi:hypothetical protein